jgi:phosphatidylglycerol:prolipoprotein diacylglycerol transferase
MNSIALSIGPVSIRWYGIIMCLAIIAGLVLAIREGKRYQIPSDFFTDLLLIGAPSAIVGARIYYVAFKWDYYQNHLLEVFMVWQGGIAIYGALIGAIIGGYFFIRSKGYSFWRIADIVAPSLIIGQIIGRWGNFTNQEAHGGPVEESFLRNTLHLPGFIVDQMNVQGMGIYYHPTFLYESLWNIVGILLLFWLRRRPFLKAGELFASYFIWYSIGRFFIEGLRADSLDFSGPSWLAACMNALWSPMNIFFEPGPMTYGGNVRISQLVALLIIITAVTFIIVRRRNQDTLAHYSDPIESTIKKQTQELA